MRGIIKDILVHEGDLVKAGQVLVRMDAEHVGRRQQADAGASSRWLALQLRRIDAELGGRRTRTQPDDRPTVRANARRNIGAHVRRIWMRWRARTRCLAKAEQDLSARVERRPSCSETLPIYQDQERSWKQLVEEGFAGRLLAEERKRQRIEAEQELKAQAHTIAGARATHAAVAASASRSSSRTYRQELYTTSVWRPPRSIQKAEQEWEKQAHRNECWS